MKNINGKKNIIIASLLMAIVFFIPAHANNIANYLAADMALRDMNPLLAARYYDKLKPDYSATVARTYLMAGQYKKAKNIKDENSAVAQILKAMTAMERGKWQKSLSHLNSISNDEEDIFWQYVAVSLMRAWALAGDQRPDEALSVLQEFQASFLVEIFNAQAQYIESYSASDKPGKNIPIDMLANVFLQMGDLLSEGYPQDALIYARLSAYLNDDNIVAFYLISDILAEHEHYNAAIDILKTAAKKHKDSDVLIALQIADYYQLSEQKPLAEKSLLKLRKAHPENRDVRHALADFYRRAESHEKAIALYNEDIAAFSVGGESLSDAEESQVFYYRGISYEQLGDWEKAEIDFLLALELAPDDPYVMNYLGYSWVERGENLQQAFDILQEAASLREHNGAIADSLGWAYYRLQDYNSAVVHLEKAVVLSPEIAVIVDHLGDAYWQVGRHLEAQFQWKRALLSADLTDDLRTIIEGKLQMIKDGSTIVLDSL